jgi:hypothetical protein
MQTIGSKAQVWHGTANHTTGGLTKSNLMKNKHGRIVSKRKHHLGKKSIKNLKKLGYVAKKGQFKLFHKHTAKKGRSRRMRGGMNHQSTSNNNVAHNASNSTHKPMKGGMAYGGPLIPQSYNGSGQGTSGVALQFMAGNAA